MRTSFSVEIDKYNPTALAHSLKKMEDSIPDFEWGWKMTVNAGGIDYGIYLNINTEKKEIEICNQPEYGSDGEDTLEEVFEALGEEDGDDDEEVQNN